MILLSILVAGRAITSDLSAFKAAMMVGMITTRNANEPAILGKLFCSLKPAFVANSCTLKVETRLVSNAAYNFGNDITNDEDYTSNRCVRGMKLKILSTILVNGANKPSRASSPVAVVNTTNKMNQ